MLAQGTSSVRVAVSVGQQCDAPYTQTIQEEKTLFSQNLLLQPRKYNGNVLEMLSLNKCRSTSKYSARQTCSEHANGFLFHGIVILAAAEQLFHGVELKQEPEQKRPLARLWTPPQFLPAS